MPSLLHASARRPPRLALASLLFLVLAACGQPAPAAPVATDHVDLPRSYRFAPEDITVQVGTTVTWSNNDNFTHSVQLLDGGEAQTMKPGESVTHTFATSGLFRYTCSLHPKDMNGSVLVGESSG